MQQRTGINILVVDDEESIRNVVSQVLEEDGHKVATAESGEAALEMLSNSAVQLVITDIRMEGINGIELLEKIKNSNPEVEVIIITSHASMDTSIKALRNGAFDYLLKPFESIDAISETVNKVVEKISQKKQQEHSIEMLKALSEDVLNRLDVAAILVDATGTPVLTNKHAQKILSDDSELMIENGKLTTTSLNSRRQLSELLRNVSQQRGDSAKEFALMKIQRSSSPIPLTVLVSCVGGMPEGAGRSAPMVLVLISNENQTIKVPAEIINLLYGLTPAESRLTLALVDGLELDEIATKFCVSQNTLRVQLRSIFKKTGVRRQSELVKLVLSGLAKYSA